MDAYRHGIRVSALVSLRMRDIDVKSARIGVERKKGSLSTEQPLEADELRALKRYLKYRGKTRLPWLFLTEGKNRFSRQGVNLLLQRIGEKAKLEFKVQPHMLGMGVVLRLRAVGMIRGGFRTTWGIETRDIRYDTLGLQVSGLKGCGTKKLKQGENTKEKQEAM